VLKAALPFADTQKLRSIQDVIYSIERCPGGEHLLVTWNVFCQLCAPPGTRRNEMCLAVLDDLAIVQQVQRNADYISNFSSKLEEGGSGIGVVLATVQSDTLRVRCIELMFDGQCDGA
jgi:hypothetical protein